MATSKTQTPAFLDISHHNTVLSFQDIYKAGIRGIIHKASQGTTVVDTTYAKRRKDALWAGHLWGAYHWITSANIKQQVSAFLKAADPNENTLLACDAERNDIPGWNANLDQIKEFLQLLFDKTGQRPKLYGGEYLKSILDGRPDPFLSQHDLWLSQYGPKAVCPPGWSKPWGWQFSEHGKIDGMGVDGNVDFNSYDGSNLSGDWVRRVVVPLKAPDLVTKLGKLTGTAPTVVTGVGGVGGAINGVLGAAGGGGNGAAFSIPAADPPKDEPLTFSTNQKVTASDLLPVSRKVTRLTLLKHTGHVIAGGIGVDKVMAWLGMAKDARSQVEGFVSDHAWVIGMTAAVVVVLVARDIIGLVVDDINQGRAVASGSVTPTEATT